MYYWKTQDLATQIKEGDISEELKKNYYVATSIIATAFMYIAIAGGTQDGVATLTECILLIIVTVLGINITFKSNGGDNGANYISRVVMLSLPLLIKIVIFSFLGGIVIGIAAGASEETDLDLSQWGVTAVSVLAQVFFFWRINVHLCHINT
jgi:ABC-type antimicrobial peptide transport system permease subunit